jgi:hypothetical protein
MEFDLAVLLFVVVVRCSHACPARSSHTFLSQLLSFPSSYGLGVFSGGGVDRRASSR